LPGSQQPGLAQALVWPIPGQQTLPVTPHIWQAPPAQTMLGEPQLAPLATHAPALQHSPPGHALPAQHMPPTAPQGTHMPLWQTLAPEEQAEPLA
jgi:hypothetical protein